jgi:hypothetical protein
MRAATIGLACTLYGRIVGAEEPSTGDWLREHVKPVLSERVRGEFVDWFRPRAAAAASGANRYDFFASQLRAGVKVDVPHVAMTFVGQDTRLVNLPDDASGIPGAGNLGPGALYFAHSPHLRNDNTDQGETFLKEGWVRVHDVPHAPGLTADLGRFEYSDGLESMPQDPTLVWLKRQRIGERLIGPFGYTHVTRSFDGVRTAYTRSFYDVTAVAFHPTHGGFEVSANRDMTDVSLAGLATTMRPFGDTLPSDIRFFYLYYEDRRSADRTKAGDNPPVKVDNRPAAARRADTDAIALHMAGAHFLTAFPLGPGTVDGLFWGVAQGGDWGVQSHSAWAYALEAGYQPKGIPWSPWIRAGYDQSSGDDDPTDGQHHTFFQVLPTARIYAQLPFYNLMNDQDTFVQALLRPHPKVTLRTDWHWLRLSEKHDLWYAGGGATNDDVFGFSGIAANGRRELAQLLDVGVTLTVTSQLQAYAYYGHAFGGGVVKRTFAGSNANYGYVEMAFRY